MATKSEKNGEIYQYNESENIIWFAMWLTTSSEWMIWCERDGKRVHGLTEYRKRLSKELKSAFKIK